MTESDQSLPVPGLVRRVRRIADMSQRQLADAAGVTRATIARIETGETAPSLGLLSRLLEVADLRLVVVDAANHVVDEMRVWDDRRDGADRRFPAHLDVILDPRRGDWWGDIFGLDRPPETFRRDRTARDRMRRRSQWAVRVSRHRNEPPPPAPRPQAEGWG